MKSKETAIVLDGQNVVVNREYVAMRGDQMSEMKGLECVLDIDTLEYPLYEVGACEHAWYFGHEALDGPNGHTGRLNVLHLLDDRLDPPVHEFARRLIDAYLLQLLLHNAVDNCGRYGRCEVGECGGSRRRR